MKKVYIYISKVSGLINVHYTAHEKRDFKEVLWEGDSIFNFVKEVERLDQLHDLKGSLIQDSEMMLKEIFNRSY